jgi:hypothetical protein
MKNIFGSKIQNLNIQALKERDNGGIIEKPLG